MDWGRRCERGITYTPLPSQQRFHRCRARFKGFSGPVGSGKSQALCQEAIRLAYLNPGRMGLLGAPTYPMLRDATVQSLLEILNQSEIPYDLHKAEFTITLRDTKSKIVCRSLDEPERLRGLNLAWFGVDELTYATEQAWTRLEGRLRDPKATELSGFAVWTPRGHDWVFERFIAKPVEGYEMIFAAPYENRHLLSKVPDFYERLKSSYDDRFFAQEVLGEYLNTNAGRVYSAFDRKRHIQVRPLDQRTTLYWAVDFNVDPMSSIVAQVFDGHCHVHDEIVLSRSGTRAATEEFLRRFGQHPGGFKVHGDAAGNFGRTTGGTDYDLLKKVFREAGFPHVEVEVPKSNPPVRDRVALVNAELKTAADETRLTVDSKCRELIKDFEEMVYKPDSGVIDKERDKKRSHLSDALGYHLWQVHDNRPRVGERGSRLF